MKIDLITPALPPQLNGIGDYTACLAAALATGASGSPTCSVRVLTARGHQHDPIPGVGIVGSFSPSQRQSVRRIVDHVAARRPDWVLLQYNPFSFGRWGLNLYLPGVFAAIRRRSPATRLGLMTHEPFVPLIGCKYAVMTTWQRWQLWKLGQSADVLLFSIEPWAKRFSAWFPGKRIHHLPVGSNIPDAGFERGEARARLGLARQQMVLGFFGAANPTRALEHVRATGAALRHAGVDALLLYVGKDGAALRAAAPEMEVRDEGPLPALEVSRCMAAMDLYLAPYVDGVSTRRTSFMTGLQHGAAIVGTSGPLTDRELREAEGQAFLLADVQSPHTFAEQTRRLIESDPLRQRLGREAARLYQERYTWERIARRLIESLGDVRVTARVGVQA